MENETTEKELKEKAKIEKVAASKADEEIAEELTPLKDQVKEIQSTLNTLESNETTNRTRTATYTTTTTITKF